MTRGGFRSALDSIQQDLLRMGSLVDEAVYRAVKSLQDRDMDLARAVVEGDEVIDRLNLDIEQRCLELIALQQPMAGDLRALGTALKISSELERMADNATDIAKVTIRLEGQPLIKPLIDIPRMAEIGRGMLRDSLNAFVHRDAGLAREMIERDHEVDHLYRQIFSELLLLMIEDPRKITQGTYLLFVAKYLERIADHATNLGEWVIYMVTGQLQELNN